MLVLILSVAVSVSQGTASPPPPAPATSADTEATALFRKGVAAYDAHAYRSAVELFRSAYELSKTPAILFNIGQTYRALGDCANALASFDAFVAVAPGNDPLMAKAKTRQTELRACAAPIPPVPETVSRPTTPLPPVRPPSLAVPPAGLNLTVRPTVHSADGRTIVCAASAGGAVTLAAVGIGLGVAAWSASRDVGAATDWNSETIGADARGRALGNASLITLGAAGVASVVAATSCWLSWRAHRAAGR